VITLLRAALIGVGASVLLLLGGLALAPFVLKDRVVELVGRQISERLEATVSFEEVELSLLSTFPTLIIEVAGLEVVGAAEARDGFPAGFLLQHPLLSWATSAVGSFIASTRSNHA